MRQNEKNDSNEITTNYSKFNRIFFFFFLKKVQVKQIQQNLFFPQKKKKSKVHIVT